MLLGIIQYHGQSAMPHNEVIQESPPGLISESQFLLWNLLYRRRYAYCFHVAWARMLPKPYGAVVTYGSIPLFYVCHKMRRLLGELFKLLGVLLKQCAKHNAEGIHGAPGVATLLNLKPSFPQGGSSLSACQSSRNYMERI